MRFRNRGLADSNSVVPILTRTSANERDHGEAVGGEPTNSSATRRPTGFSGKGSKLIRQISMGVIFASQRPAVSNWKKTDRINSLKMAQTDSSVPHDLKSQSIAAVRTTDSPTVSQSKSSVSSGKQSRMGALGRKTSYGKEQELLNDGEITASSVGLVEIEMDVSHQLGFEIVLKRSPITKSNDNLCRVLVASICGQPAADTGVSRLCEGDELISINSKVLEGDLTVEKIYDLLWQSNKVSLVVRRKANNVPHTLSTISVKSSQNHSASTICSQSTQGEESPTLSTHTALSHLMSERLTGTESPNPMHLDCEPLKSLTSRASAPLSSSVLPVESLTRPEQDISGRDAGDQVHLAASGNQTSSDSSHRQASTGVGSDAILLVDSAEALPWPKPVFQSERCLPQWQLTESAWSRSVCLACDQEGMDAICKSGASRLTQFAELFVDNADRFPSDAVRLKLLAECLAEEFDLPFLL